MCEFDIHVDDTEEIRKVTELIALGDSYFARSEYQAAQFIYSRASSSDIGKLALSRFYMHPEVTLDFSYIDRLRKAEQLLLEIEREKSNHLVEACSLLATLYSQIKKPVSVMGYQLRRERLRGTADPDMVMKTLALLQKRPITVLEEDSYGAFVLAEELGCYEGNELRRWERFLFQAAAEYGKGAFAGIAALYLADLYSSKDPKTADKYRKLACKLGNPEILSHN